MRELTFMTSFEKIRYRLRSAHLYGLLLTDEERSLLDQEIDAVVDAIAQGANIEEVNSKLDELGKMEDVIATLFCKYQVSLSEKQYRLFQDFDRWDLPEIRTAVVASIKKGDFLMQPLFPDDESLFPQ